MATKLQPRRLYEFGPFLLDAVERRLLQDGREVALAPKVFETLLVLVENSGCILEKDELMKLLWPDSFVEEGNLAQNIFVLRRTLGANHYIETIPRRGYRFNADVREINQPAINVLNGVINGGPPAVEGALPDAAVQPQSVQESGVSRSTFFPNRPQWRRNAVIAVAVLLATLGIIGASRLNSRKQAAGKKEMSLAKFTSAGKSMMPALSPDGRYVAYISDDLVGQSIWMRQMATTSAVQVVAPAEVSYLGLTFTPDGNFLVYSLFPKGSRYGALYRVPTLGGVPQKLAHDIDGPATFSPDGKQLAFIRNYPDGRGSTLMLIDKDGGNERKLTARQRPEFFWPSSLAWSPRGDLIACAIAKPGSVKPTQLIGINPFDGSETSLSEERWIRVGGAKWFPDGSALIIIARDQGGHLPGGQLWMVSYPGGAVRRVTNDLHGYSEVSLTPDASTLLTTQHVRISRMWMVPGGDEKRAVPTTPSIIDNSNERLGLSWLPDGRIVYGAQVAGNADLWISDGKSEDPRQLTSGEYTDLFPVASPDGRYIVFISNRGGYFSLWRMNANGENLIRLTEERGDDRPSFTPDGKTVVYVSYKIDSPSIWKVSIDGGKPTQLTTEFSGLPVVSPDGKWIFCYHFDGKAGLDRPAIIPINGGAPVRFFDLQSQPAAAVRWSPDGRSLHYIFYRDGISNIWSQPIDGSPPRQITDFKTDWIFRFAWSKDGRTLACERGTSISDIVQVSDFR
jgi:Tol biopolymer transport system component/DNA-binding winged helix-turn-helix (wHTH) protein